MDAGRPRRSSSAGVQVTDNKHGDGSDGENQVELRYN